MHRDQTCQGRTVTASPPFARNCWTTPFKRRSPLRRRRGAFLEPSAAERLFAVAMSGFLPRVLPESTDHFKHRWRIEFQPAMAPRHEHAKGAARSEPELVPKANPPLQADFRYYYQASIRDGLLQIQRISGRRSRREKRGRKTYPHFNVRRHTHERVKLRYIIVSWSS